MIDAGTLCMGADSVIHRNNTGDGFIAGFKILPE
jgi:hypothetical protein